MNLQEMSTKDLLALHNQIADKVAGPKTFATRGKLLDRIESVAAAKNIDLASFGQHAEPEVTEPHAQPQADVTEETEVIRTFDLVPEKKPSGKGIGRLARELLMDPAGTSHAEIAAEVNRKIPGAQATAKSVRWYAHKMRKDGIQVPSRRKTVIDDGTVQDDSTTP